jgi:heme ABC exporter ATP-binding subunit CcmA
MEPVIHLRAVVSLLGRFPALAGIDLDVARGEVVVLHGANGAGKSTLLRLCAGLVAPTSGVAEVLGHDLARDRRSGRRRVGLLGHGSGLYDELTVADNVAFWARTAGVPAAEAAAAMARMGVGGRLAEVPAARLSAGQRRRASLACLVARRPELWLLDEPHAGLDAEGRDQLDELVLGAADAGATVVVASHEHDRTARLSSRVVTLAGGVVHADTASGRVSGVA